MNIRTIILAISILLMSISYQNCGKLESAPNGKAKIYSVCPSIARPELRIERYEPTDPPYDKDSYSDSDSDVKPNPNPDPGNGDRLFFRAIDLNDNQVYQDNFQWSLEWKGNLIDGEEGPSTSFILPETNECVHYKVHATIHVFMPSCDIDFNFYFSEDFSTDSCGNSGGDDEIKPPGSGGSDDEIKPGSGDTKP